MSSQPLLRSLSLFSLLAFGCLLAPHAASAQAVRELQLSVSAGNTEAPRTDASFFSAAQLPQVLNVSSNNGATGYTASRTGIARIERASTLAEGLLLYSEALVGFSDNDANSIPTLGVFGTAPSAAATSRIQSERISVTPPEGLSSVRVRIHGALSSQASGLLGTNRPWVARGNTFFNLSASVRRQSNDAVQTSVTTGTTLRHLATSDQGAHETTLEGFWGQATGTGAWNSLGGSGEGYVELTLTGSEYLEFTVNLIANASVLDYERAFTIFGEALSDHRTAATGRVWITLPDGGVARSTLGGLTRRGQTLTFPAIPTQTVDSSPVALQATSSASLPITYTVVSGPASVSGSTLTLTGQRGEGFIELRADQAGDGEFAPATITQIITVQGRAQTITFPALSSRPADSAPFAPGASSDSGLPITYQIVSGPATTDGTLVTLTGQTGTVRVRATQPGGGPFSAAESLERTFAVTAATGSPVSQTITFPSLLNAEVGTGQLLLATASSGLPVTYEVIAGSATLGGINNNILTATAPGLVTVRATQAGGSASGTTYSAAPSVERSFTAAAAPALLTQTLSAFNPPAQLTFSGDTIELAIYPTASSDLPVTLSVVSGPASIAPVSGAVRIEGTGTVLLRAEQAGDTTYAPVAEERSILVTDAASPVAQTISLNGFPLNLGVGGAPVLLSATATSGLPVAYELVTTYPEGPSIAALSGNQLTATAPGYVTLRATQPGGVRQGITYAAAPPVERILPVLPSAMRALDLHGAWTLAQPDPGATLALVFAADGKYYHAEAGADDPDSQDGIEIGTYTWSLIEGALNATPDLDLNDQLGLSHPLAPLQVIVSGDTLLGREGDDYFTLRRVRGSSPLVGAWRLPVEGGEAVLVFFPDASYLHLENAPADETSQPGLETGAYTWNTSTGRLTATPSLDQNGEWGLSHSATDLAVRVTGDQLAIREGGATVATATRVGSATAARTQTINFARPSSRAFGSAPFALNASATSRLPVAFAVVSGSAQLGEDGRTLTVLGAGEIVLRATQAGNAAFLPAEPVQQTLVVTRAAQRITFPPPAPVSVGDEPMSLLATSSSGLPPQFVIVSSSPEGAAGYNADLGVLIPQSAGRVTLRATQAGDANHSPAPPVTRVLEIRPRAPLPITTTAGDGFFVGGRPIRSLAVDTAVAGLRYFSSDLPAGLVLSPATGELSGVITARPGTYTVRVWTQVGSIRSEFSTSSITVAPFPAEFVGGCQIPFTTPGESSLPWGRLDLQVASNGTFTGTLNSAAAAPRPVRGRLHPTGDGGGALAELSTPQGLLRLVFGPDSSLDAEVFQSDAVVAVADALLPLRTKADGSVPWAGAYTLSFAASAPLAEPLNPVPVGPGYATGRVASTGVFTVKGHLPDGTPLTLSLASGRGEEYDARPSYLWFVRPHKTGENYFAGHTSLTRDASVTPARYDISVASDQKAMHWKKSAQTGSGAYAAGFGPSLIGVRLQAWSPPTAAINLATRLGATTTPVQLAPFMTLDGEEIDIPEADALPAAVLLGANNRFSLPADTPAASARAWSFKLDAATGRITGGFLVPATPGGTARARNVKFTGVLFQPGANTQDEDLGAAYFLLPPETAGGQILSGELYFSPLPN